MLFLGLIQPAGNKEVLAPVYKVKNSPFLGSPNETLRGYFGEIIGSFGFVKG